MDRSCAVCRGALERIKVVDKGHQGAMGILEYAAVDANRSFWTGRYPVRGQVAALMCQQCGRIELFGVPYAEE